MTGDFIQTTGTENDRESGEASAPFDSRLWVVEQRNKDLGVIIKWAFGIFFASFFIFAAGIVYEILTEKTVEREIYNLKENFRSQIIILDEREKDILELKKEIKDLKERGEELDKANNCLSSRRYWEYEDCFKN